jgi:hypothetical protein
MKKTLLTGFTLLSLSIFSQITINSSDVYVSGERVINFDQNNPQLDPGTAGANQVYDFNFMFEDNRDTVLYAYPNLTANASAFPTSTVVSISSFDSTTIYLINNGTSLEVNGMIMPIPQIPVPGVIKASNNLTQMTFPSTFQTVFTDDAAMSSNSIPFYQEISADPLVYVDSMRINIAITRTSVIDGWGTIITPSGTFVGLRQKTMDIQTITIEANMFGTIFGVIVPLGFQPFPGGDIIDTTFTYTYLANKTLTSPLIIAEIETDFAGNITSASYAEVAPPIILGQNEINKDKNFEIYPNPVNDNLSIVSETEIEKVEVFNMDGRLVKTNTYKSKNISFSMNELNAGNYLVRIYSKEEIVSKHIQKL